jgi:hypothetical protein
MSWSFLERFGILMPWRQSDLDNILAGKFLLRDIKAVLFRLFAKFMPELRINRMSE